MYRPNLLAPHRGDNIKQAFLKKPCGVWLLVVGRWQKQNAFLEVPLVLTVQTLKGTGISPALGFPACKVAKKRTVELPRV